MLNSRKNIPYIGNPGSACALACYTMVAKHFFPEVTFDDMAKISNWKPGYVVWGFTFFLWLLDRNFEINNYDLIDYNAWADEGIEGLRKSIPEKEFEYYLAKTYNLDSYTEDIQKMMSHHNFKYHKKKPTWDDLATSFKRPNTVCDVGLNASSLDNEDGFNLHRVTILDITDEYIEFHDPRGSAKERPCRKESHEHFIHAWLNTVDAPELCAYTKL